MPALPPSAAVVDLGSAPGAWLQVLVERLGPSARIVGVDLEPVDELDPSVRLLQLDMTHPATPARIREVLGRQADAVLCDAAPKLSGIPDVDRSAADELGQAALRIADAVLAPHSSLVVKGFPGPEADRFREQLRAHFERVRELRPEGKRATSKEFYWLASSGEPKRRARRRRIRRGSPA